MAFENDVKMYGTQAGARADLRQDRFENDVKMYGTQAKITKVGYTMVFENDVKMYGTQALHGIPIDYSRLRMM